MKTRAVRHLGPTLALGAALCLAGGTAAAGPRAPSTQCQTYETCRDLGAFAYVFGYPLVIMGVSADVATNVPNATAQQGRAPVNQFSNNPLPDASYIDIVLPSVSTPYSNAILDLTKEPVVMTLPDLGDRFFLMQVLDAWTNSGGLEDACMTGEPGFCAVGSRYGTTAGNYAFVGPGWKGTLPPGIDQTIVMPTNLVLIAGRTFTTGTAEDLAEVREIQLGYELTPLGKFGKPYTPPMHAPVDPSIDMNTGPRDQVAALPASAFFEKLADMMRSNPPLPDDTAAVAALARIGIVPGRPFQFGKLDANTPAALEEGYAAAQDVVVQAASTFSPTSTNWNMSLDLGDYGRRYLLRAGVAYGALGANLDLDSVYAGAIKDADGATLCGGGAYTLHFDADQMPPVDARAFWSVTLYQRPLENLYDAPEGRNALGVPAAQGHPVQFNPDGSLDITLQSTPPSPDPNSTERRNWIPTPPGKDFILLLRMYWPTDALFRHVHPWIPPAVQRVAACPPPPPQSQR